MTVTRTDPGKGGGALAAPTSYAPASPLPDRRQLPVASPPGAPPKQELQGLSIDQVNHVVDRVNTNHMRLFGTKAQPGLIFDVARGVGQKVVHDVDQLFQIPRSQREALIQGTTPEDFRTVQQQRQEQEAASREARGLTPIKPETFMTAEDSQALHEAGLGFGSHAKWIPQGLGQILSSLVNTFPGAYYLGKATTLDMRDYAYKAEHDYLHIPVPAPVPKKEIHGGRLAKTGVELGHQVARDFTHKENWGFALMDFWAAASLGAGTGSRLASAAGRAGELERAASVGRVEKGLQAVEGFRKPDVHPGFEIGYGAYTEHIPAFQNAALRLIQGWYIGKAQRGLLERQSEGFDVRLDPFSNNALERGSANLGAAIFSTENLLHRARLNRNNIEYAIATAPLVELDRLTNWNARAKAAIGYMREDKSLKEAWGRVSVDERFGIDKAIQLIMTDSPDPISAWRAFHHRSIDEANEQRADFESVTKEEADALKAAHQTHKEAAADLIGQADALEAGQVQPMRLDQAEALMRYQPAAESPSIRALARELLGSGFGDESVLVRERRLTDEQKITLQKKEDELHDTIIKIEQKEDKRGLSVLLKKQERLEKEVAAIKKIPGLSLQGERAHDLVAAAKLAGIQDIPTKIRVVGDREIANLRTAAKEQLSLARKIRPRMRKATAIMGLTEKSRERQLREFDYRVASHEAQLEAINVAERVLTNPPKRFKEIVDRAYAISAYQEMLKEITYGFDPEIGNQHLAEIAAILDGDKLVPILDEKGNPTNRLGRVVGGETPDVELRKNVRSATSEVRRSRQKLQTLQLRKTKRVKASPKLDDQITAAQKRISAAEDALLAAQEAHDTAGSRIEPLEKRVLGEGETPTDAPQLATIADMRAGRGSSYFGRLEHLPEATSTPNMPKPRRNRRYGFGPPKIDSTAFARMDGTVLQIGDFRWDTSQLLAEELRQVWKAAFMQSHYHDLWSIGVNEKLSTWHQPVRDIASVPENLKKVVSALERNIVDPDAAKILTQENLDKLRAWLYPNKEEIATGIPHVRWVDERMAMDRFGRQRIDFWQSVDQVMSKGTGWLNEPWRLLVIFGSPAYILNAGGAAVTLAVEHGFASPGLLGRAWGSTRIWNGEVTRMLDQLAGSTHAAALVTEKGGPLATGRSSFYRAWQKLTDRSFRRAAVIGELMKRGIISDSMSPDEVMAVLQEGVTPMLDKLRRGPGEGPLRSSDIGRQVIEAAQVGRKQMLDFDKMSWPERATLRHLIFVYAFLRAGSIWSMRFMGEHPVQWAVTAHAGEDRRKQIEELIGKTPSWFTQNAYMPVDNNTVFNPVQFNMPSVLSQVAYSAQSLFNDAPYSSVDDLAGPAVTLGADIARGTTSSGQPLPKTPFGGRLAGSFLDLVENTPPGYVYQRQQKLARQEKLKIPPPPTVVSETNPLEGAGRRERSFLNLNSFDLDGFWNNYGRLIGRTAVPQDVQDGALHARYWRDVRAKDPDAFIAHQLDLVKDVVKKQAQVLGETSVPADVENALNLVAAREAYIEKWKLKEHIPSPGDRQLAVLTIAFLKQQGIINQSKANEYKKLLSEAHGKSAQRGVWLKALHENGGQAWADWVERVNVVNYFNTDNFTSVVNNLKDAELGDYTTAAEAKNDVKWQYGRRYLDYLDKRNELRDQARAANTSADRRVYLEQIRQLDDEASNDVTVNGVTFPSMRAVQFGKLNPDQRQQYLRSRAISPWWTQDDYSRELLTGNKPDPAISQGYAVLAQWMQEKGDALKPGEHLPANTRTYYAQILADRAASKGNTSLRDDLIFAGILPKPDGSKTLLAERLKETTPIQGSLYRAQWEYMLGYASYAFRRSVDAGWVTSNDKPNYTGISEVWASYYVPRVQTWLQKQTPGFQREVETYEQEHPKFLQRLARP